jgi:O-antigen/teichoic acid export membrane protein
MLKNMMKKQSGRSKTTLSESKPSTHSEKVIEGRKPSGLATTFTRNAAVSIGRLIVASLVALVLPAYLTHKLPVTVYSAWVLILQLSGYVAYLDFGVQNGISKYVSEYEARGDAAGANLRASAGLAIMLLMSVLGVLMTLLLAWRVPQLFHQMPVALYRDVRISLIFVGISLSFGLLCSVFSAIFLGLQRYAVPMFISILNRVLFTGVVYAAIFFHRGLVTMGVAVACVNISTGLLQIQAWRKLASRIRVSLYLLNRVVLKRMLAYCSVLAIWSAGMLCVNGLDVTIVGTYDFSQTGFFAIATLPINFMISIMGAALGPFLPTTSALSIQRTPAEMGDLLSRTTRYITILLIFSGLPLLVGGCPILRLWVGQDYAFHSIGYLRLLVLANTIRMLCAPYATMLMATASQKVAIVGATAEAIVNLVSSIYLARHMGAMGVAYGTLLGAFVSVAMHFALSMHYTYAKISISRSQLFLKGIFRPAVILVPSVIVLPLWWFSGNPGFTLSIWLSWAASTLLLGWFVALNKEERNSLMGFVENGMKLATIS